MVEEYDPATDTWTQEDDMRVSRAAGLSNVVDGKIYIIGGYGGSQRVDEHDPSTNAWTMKSEMPSARRSLSTSALDGKIYAFGGYVPGVSGHPGVVTVQVYDPATDTWTPAPDMPTAISRGFDMAYASAWSHCPKPSGYWLIMPPPVGVCIWARV